MIEEEILLTWVHLSDFHFESTKGSIIADQALILDELARDIKEHNKRGVPKPDLIIVTGDIAQTGDATEKKCNLEGEYTAAATLISSIRQILNLPKDTCLFVPGNHDVNRKSSSNNLSRLLTVLRDGNEVIDDVLSDDKDRLLLFERISGYSDFIKDNAPHCIDEHGNTWWSYLYKTVNLNVRFIGLNTSLLSDTDDIEKLQVGNTQLKHLLIDKKSSEDEVLVAVSHHPVEWLKDSSNVRPFLEKKCDVHMYGHIHDSNFVCIRKGSGQSIIEVAAGAAYCCDSGYHSYGYNISSIVKKNDGSIIMRCWPRLWSDKNKEFRDDVNILNDQDKFSEHQLRAENKDLVGELELPAKVSVGFNNDAPTPIKINFTKDNYDCDPPPFSSAWVGRETEIDIIKDPTIRVFAITGIGGQGKSALASKIIEEIDQQNEIYWDWRDCREIGDTFQTHLVRMIERITVGKTSAKAFIGEDISTIIYYFFDLIKSFNGYFVLDNIDHYVDVEEKKPIDAMKQFIDAAISRNHKSKIILTCRPSIQYDRPSFFEISLPGFSVEETHKLFLQRGVVVDDQTRKDIYSIQKITQGHPLWLNLIATQVAKNKTSLSVLIHEIKKGKDSGLPFPTLDSIWKTLNDKQKTILRCMAETIRPESSERLEKYLSSQLNYNQLSRGLKSLKLLNLIVEKKSSTMKELLELHPLIKSYILNHFPRTERRKYINIITAFFDKTIIKCRKEINNKASFAMLEFWVMRSELAINAGNYEDALGNLNEVADALCSSGYSHEFIRVCCDLFDEIDFVEAILNEYQLFDEVFHLFADCLALYGKFIEAEMYLNKYKSSISGKSARYVNYCNLMCYMYWNKKDYPAAVHWGKIGSDLKQSSNLDTRFDCDHNLALARRDNGEIDLALSYFLSGKSLVDILIPNVVDEGAGGHFYGNIGRCLWFNNEIDDALLCYKKALNLLENKDKDESNENRGWGRFWVAEAFEKKEDFHKAYCFYLGAKKMWDRLSPPKASMSENKALELLSTKKQITHSESLDDYKIEKLIQEWIVI